MEALEKGVSLELAMCGKDGCPYVLLFNYGFGEDFIIAHGARDGKKIDILKDNSNVAPNVVIDTEVILEEGAPSEFSMKYRSVSGLGIAKFIENIQEREAQKILMENITVGSRNL